MITNLELYGTEDVPPVPKAVANERITLLRLHLEKLRALPFEHQQNYTEVKVIEAIAFWKKLSDQEDVGI
jgi:hypothetical protein